MFTDMANNKLLLLDTVIIPTLRNTIYSHKGRIIAMRWYYDDDGIERQRVKILFTDDSEKWYETDKVVKFHEV